MTIPYCLAEICPATLVNITIERQYYSERLFMLSTLGTGPSSSHFVPQAPPSLRFALGTLDQSPSAALN